jgi:hypothetical protein
MSILRAHGREEGSVLVVGVALLAVAAVIALAVPVVHARLFPPGEAGFTASADAWKEAQQSPVVPGEIPFVVGLDVDQARDRLTAAGFTRVTVANAATANTSVVADISPSVGSNPARDQLVTLVLMVSPGPSDEPPSDG